MTTTVAPWRLRVASAIVALLAVGLAATTWLKPAPADHPSPAVSTTNLASATFPAPSTTLAASGSPEASRSDDEVRRVVTDALVAWGDFAASGDLDDVAGYFDPDGPQWASLSSEAGSAGAGFTVEIVERSLVSGSQSTEFIGDITIAIGEIREVVTWTIELRLSVNGSWLIWSVSDAS